MPEEYENPAEDLLLLTEEQVRLKRPAMYRVIMLNDDYTPMDFVVWVIQNIFHRGIEDATRMMLEVHTQGSSIMGAYPHDVARTKIERVEKMAEENQHPLQCVMEKEDGDDGAE